MFSVPVLLLIFKRPDLTGAVLETLRAVKPARLFVAADGPGTAEEKVLCERARSIIGKVDWACEVQTLFRNEHLGCRSAVSTAIDWFFESVDEGIILEDDVVASQSFFTYCRELLAHYRHDSSIMHISGENPLDHPVTDDSYYFSKLQHCWGWATWKRAWRCFDAAMPTLDAFLESGAIQNIFFKKNQQQYWEEIFTKVRAGAIDSWAYIWTYTIFFQNGLWITPNRNLTRNIGFGAGSTHTTADDPLSRREIHDIALPLQHPRFFVCAEAAMDEVMQKRFRVCDAPPATTAPSFAGRVLSKLRTVQHMLRVGNGQRKA